MARRKVVITGIGVVSCLGVGADRVTESLRHARSGIRLLPERRELGFRSALSGVIDDFAPRFPLPKKTRKNMTPYALWSYESVMEAVTSAKLPMELLRSPRTGVIFGNDSSCRASFEQAEITRAQGNTSQIGSGAVFQSMTSCASMNLATVLGIQGASWSLSGACASGGHAIGQAAELIACGRQDRIICGGAQEINWEVVCSFDAICAFSTREGDPEAASRPFDADRDGLVPSGGSAAVLLEDLESARGRGAPILGEVLAYAFSSDGAHIALANGEGLARCMAEVLELGGVAPADVDLVSAHATSTPIGDAVEAEAIDAVFGGAKPWVMSTKSMTGHEMWASGAAQVVYSLLMAHNGFISANLNFERPDERTAGLRIPAETVAETAVTVLCNSAGFGGTNSCLLVRAGS
jgi:3-oxoacyl-[acyl-carrier-protein] synthase-1